MQAVETGSGNGLDRLFKFKQWNTSLKRDTLAGLTTFIVMSYIIFVNPSILGLGGEGLPFAAALTSTCLVAGVMTILMGVVTNRAYAIAPGMGLNAVVAFSLVLGQGLSFKSAMGLIFLEGVAITILVLTGFREAIFKAIPLELKKAIVVGIGFFILFIGLVDGGIVVAGSGTPVTLGSFTTVPVACALFGLVITVIMLTRKWRGAIILGILFTTVLAIVLNYAYDKKAFGVGQAIIPDKVFSTPTSASSVSSTSAPSPSSASPPPSSGSSASCCRTSSTPWARSSVSAARPATSTRRATCRRSTARCWSTPSPPSPAAP